MYDDISTTSNIDLNLAVFNNYTISSQYVLCESQKTNNYRIFIRYGILIIIIVVVLSLF